MQETKLKFSHGDNLSLSVLKLKRKLLHSNLLYIAKQLLNKLTNQKKIFIPLIHF